jgi:hypothetical protein
MNFKNAGGTDGGSMRFLIGLIMMSGGYLLLPSIIVDPSFGLGSYVFSIGNFLVTRGLVIVPFLFGIGIVFYNSDNKLGWLLLLGSLTALVFGVFANLNIRFTSMSAFDLVVILVLFVGGIGWFLGSLRR